MSSKTPNCCKEPAAAAERQPEPQHRTAELENSKGESTFTLDLALTDPSKAASRHNRRIS